MVTPQKLQTLGLHACVALASHPWPVERVLSRASHCRDCGRSMLHKAGISAGVAGLPAAARRARRKPTQGRPSGRSAESAPPARRSSRASTRASCRSPAYLHFTSSARASGRASSPGAHTSVVKSLHRLVTMSHNDDMLGTMCKAHQGATLICFLFLFQPTLFTPLPELRPAAILGGICRAQHPSGRPGWQMKQGPHARILPPSGPARA